MQHLSSLIFIFSCVLCGVSAFWPWYDMSAQSDKSPVCSSFYPPKPKKKGTAAKQQVSCGVVSITTTHLTINCRRRRKSSSSSSSQHAHTHTHTHTHTQNTHTLTNTTHTSHTHTHTHHTHTYTHTRCRCIQ